MSRALALHKSLFSFFARSTFQVAGKRGAVILEQAGMAEENKVGCGRPLLEEVELEPAGGGLGLLCTKHLRIVLFGFAWVLLLAADTMIWAGGTGDRHNFTEGILL